MEWNEFNRQALKVGLRPGQVKELQKYNLIVRLKPGFSKSDVEALLTVTRRGYLDMQPTPPPQQYNYPPMPMPYPPPYPPQYYYPPPMEEEDEEEEDEGAPNWIWPLAIVLIIIAVAAVLIYIDPTIVPPAIMQLIQLGG